MIEQRNQGLPYLYHYCIKSIRRVEIFLEVLLFEEPLKVILKKGSKRKNGTKLMKILAIVAGVFFAALMYLEHHQLFLYRRLLFRHLCSRYCMYFQKSLYIVLMMVYPHILFVMRLNS